MSATDKDYDIVCEQGATLLRLFTVKNDDGSVYPLAGCTAKMQARRNHGDREVLLEASTSNGRLTIVAGPGTIRLLVADEVTATIPAISGVYDLVVTDPSGTAVRLLEGRFVVKAGVTRP